MTSEPQAPAVLARAPHRPLHVLRLRIVAVGVAILATAWVGLFVQLTTGSDPALARVLAPVVSQSADPAAAEAPSEAAARAEAWR